MIKFGLVIIVLSVAWFVWIQIGRDTTWTNSESAVDLKEVIQTDSICHRNVVAIQPYMVRSDYLNQQHFRDKLKTYFEEAEQAGYFNQNTVVLLTEYPGSWLVINLRLEIGKRRFFVDSKVKSLK